MPTVDADRSLRSAASALAALLGAPTSVVGDAVAIGGPNPVRVSLVPSHGGLSAVAPVFDAQGALVSVLSGPARDTGDVSALVSDMAAHFHACRGADVPSHAASGRIAEAAREAMSVQLGREVDVSVVRRPDEGYDVDAIHLDGRDDVVVMVAEHAAWVSSEGRRLPARDHDAAELIVADLASEWPEPAPSFR